MLGLLLALSLLLVAGCGGDGADDGAAEDGDAAAAEDTEPAEAEAPDAEAPDTEDDADEADADEQDAEDDGGLVWEAPGDMNFFFTTGAGGIYDRFVRAIAAELPTFIGDVNFHIESVSGGGGTIGLDRLARSEPDGTSLAMTTSSTWILQATEQPLDYFEVEDLGLLGAIDMPPYGVYLSAAAGRYENWEEVRASEETVRIGAGGTNPAIMGVAMDLDEHGTDFEVARFGATADARLATLAGDVDVFIEAASGDSLQNFRDGDFIPAFVFADERFEPLADYPTHIELGMPEEWSSFRAFRIVTTGLDVPDDVVSSLSEAIERVLETDALAEFEETAETPVTFIPPEDIDSTVAALLEIFEAYPDYVSEYYLN